jgi:hypothetical protein
MIIPSDPWGKIGLAESLIRQVLTQATRWPEDMKVEEIEKLEEMMDSLHAMLTK